MNRELAAHCAFLSELSYSEPQEINERLGYKADHFSKNGTDGFIARSEWGTIVVFRGTQVTARWSWDDIFTNFRMRMGQWHGGGRAHGGYMRALDAVWNDLIPILNSSARPFIYTGHSLGGALATLASTIAPYADEVYTFGSPRVGDRECVEMVSRPFFRIVNSMDIAPRFPSILGGYRHPSGTRFHLVGKKLYRDPIGFFDRVSIPGTLTLGTLAHRVGMYRQGLE